MSVFNLKKNEWGKIVSVAVDGAAGERLKALGLVKGEKIYIVAFSLFGVSVLIASGGNRIALRRSVAERIEVERV